MVDLWTFNEFRVLKCLPHCKHSWVKSRWVSTWFIISCLLVAIFPHFRHWKQPSSVWVTWLKICWSKSAEKKRNTVSHEFISNLCFTESEILLYGSERYGLEENWWSWNVSHKLNNYGWNLNVSQHGCGCVALSLPSSHTSNIQTCLQRIG